MPHSWNYRIFSVLTGLVLTALLLATSPTYAQSWPKIQPSADATKVLDTFKVGPYKKMAAGRVARETLVKGIYVLIDPNGKYAPIFLDAKNTRLKNGSSPWVDIKTGNNLTNAQTLALRQEMASNLNTDAAIRFKYGSGQTPSILVSAYDCPYCRQLEQELDAGKANATVYVFPMALQTNRPGPMGIARNIWCNATPDIAWKGMILSKNAPTQAPASCKNDARQTAELMTLFDIKAVPARIHSNGRVGPFKASDL